MIWPFSSPKPSPPGVIIRNVLGEEIDRVEGVWDLVNADLRGRHWPCGIVRLSLDGSNCEGINLFGACLVGTSFCRTNLQNAELSFSDANGANFCDADLETTVTRFDNAVMNTKSDIPGMRLIVLCFASSLPHILAMIGAHPILMFGSSQLGTGICQ